MNLRTIYIKAIHKKSSNTYVEIFRYFASGVLAFGADTLVLFLLTKYAGLYYLLSSIIGFCVGLLISYFLNVIWVFHKRKIKSKRLEFVIFLIISLIGLALNSFFMWIFTSVMLIYYIYSKIITTIIVFVWNFIAKKKSLFSK